METKSFNEMTIQECAGRGFGTAIGNLFLGFFGLCWILLGMQLVGPMNSATITLSEKVNPAVLAWLGCYLAILAGVGIYILQRTSRLLDRSDANRAKRKKINRQFALINIVQWGLIFAAANGLPHIGLGDWIVPAIILIVGLHFFPLARLFHARVHYVTGAAMVAWAIVYPILFSAGKGTSIGAIGTGAILWASAAFACWRAFQLLRHLPRFQNSAIPNEA